MSSSTLQDLRRAIYVRAKADPSWRFWGLWVHICKEETLASAYQLAKRNNGAPGSDGVSFAAIEQGGVDVFLEQLRAELVSRSYRPHPVRHVAIPKGGGQTRRLSIPTIRDRVVQGAVKLILEPIFEADFQPGSYGYRPKRKAHAAVDRVATAIAWHKTRVVDLDLRAFFDTVQHDLLLQKVAKRVRDRDVLHVLWQMLKATGQRGVPQGGVISPLLSNVYLTEVDRMLERAKRVTRDGSTSAVEYARYADDLVVLVHEGRRWDWVLRAVQRRLREEFGKLRVEVNEEKSRVVDLRNGESFGFLGFPAPQGFLGHLIAREYSQEACRDGEARSGIGGGGGSPKGDRRGHRARPWGPVFRWSEARGGAASVARRGSRVRVAGAGDHGGAGLAVARTVSGRGPGRSEEPRAGCAGRSQSSAAGQGR